jgi:hypothetical protein
MNEKSQELLTELREAMEKMPNDPEGLAGWLLSNYQLHKIGDAQPVNFYGRNQQQQQQQGGPMPANIKVNNNNIVQQMLARTGVAKSLAQRPNLKDIVNQIHNNIEADEQMLSHDNYDEYDDPYGDQYGGEYVEEYQQAAPMARQALANNSLLSGESAPPMTPADAAAMIAALGGQAKPSGENLHPVLQADRMKRLAAQQDVASGLGAGKIRRSG